MVRDDAPIFPVTLGNMCQRMRCRECGNLGVMVRPDWNERPSPGDDNYTPQF
jgi:hypothetical protein